MVWRWNSKKKKVNKNPSIFDIYDRFMPMFLAFRGVMKGSNCDNHERVKEYEQQLYDFCLHPLRDELTTSDLFYDNDLEKMFPHLQTLCHCLYKPFMDMLTEYERELFHKTFNMMTDDKYNCFKLLFLVRRLMVIPKYQTLIKNDGVVPVPSRSKAVAMAQS